MKSGEWNIVRESYQNVMHICDAHMRVPHRSHAELILINKIIDIILSASEALKKEMEN